MSANKHFSKHFAAFCTCMVQILLAMGALSAQTQTFPINVLAETQSGQCAVEHTPLDIGNIAAAFDGDESNLARSANINPMVVTLTFKYPVNAPSCSLRMASDQGHWTVEAANTLGDLTAKTGSYFLALNQSPTLGEVWDAKPLNIVGKKILRLTVLHTAGDNFVHLRDWKISANASVAVSGLCVRPNEIRLIKNATFSPAIHALDAAGNAFLINSGATWSSSNPVSAWVNSTNGTLTSGNTTGETTLNVTFGGQSKSLIVKTVDDFKPALAATRVVKVALVNIDPRIQQQGNKRFSEYFWPAVGGPSLLAQRMCDSLTAASGGVVRYEIAQTYDAPKLFCNFGGTEITSDSLYKLFLEPGWATLHLVAEQQSQSIFDYNGLLGFYNFCTQSNSHAIDEVWVYSMPFLGMYESRLTGNGAFWYNSPPLSGNACTDQLPIMGLNYERGLAEAMHSFGHRSESAMVQVHGRWNYTATPLNNWEKFAAVEKNLAGQAAVGNIHYPPNALNDYEYGVPGTVLTLADNWGRYPLLFDKKRSVTCAEWGCDQLAYMMWWYRHLPKFKCKGTDGVLNNWWAYIVDYNEAKTLESQVSNCDCTMFNDPPPSGCVGNLLQNNGFEASFTNWDNPNGATIATDAQAGTKAMSLCAATGTSRVFQTRTATAGTNYTFKAFCKKTGTAPANIFIKFLTSGFAPISTDFQQVTSTTYTEIALSKLAPIGTAYIELGFLKNDGTGCLVADEACLTTGGGGNPCSPDVMAPTISGCPGNLNLTTTAASSTASWTPPTATDNCGTPTLTSNYSPGASFPIGPTIVTYTARDAANNSAVCNFTVTVTQTGSNLPDLNLANASITNPSLAAGQVLNFKFDLKNTGTAVAAGNFNIKSYISTDNVWSANDLQDGVVPTGNVGAGATIAGVMGALTVPASLAPGSYFLILRADADNQIAESNENNNVLAAALAFTVTGGGGVSNCTAASNFPWEDWIGAVKAGTLEKTSGKSTYSDFTSTVFSLSKSVANPIVLTAAYSYFTYDEYWRVFIDYNHDNIFQVATEKAFEGILTKPANGTPTKTLTGSIAVPASALTGNAKMRVVMRRGAYGDPCGNIPFGEVEDFTVSIAQVLQARANRGDTDLLGLGGQHGTTPHATNLTGLEDLSGFGLFPNPASESVSIDLSNWQGQNAHLTFANQLGQTVFEKQMDKVENAVETLDLSGFSNGLYFVKMEALGQRAVVKRLAVSRGY